MQSLRLLWYVGKTLGKLPRDTPKGTVREYIWMDLMWLPTALWRAARGVEIVGFVRDRAALAFIKPYINLAF